MSYIESRPWYVQMEQARLDEIARMVQSEQKQAQKANEKMQSSIEQTADDMMSDSSDSETEIESRLRREIEQEYATKLHQTQQREQKALRALKQMEQRIKELENDKLALLVSASAEIDALRNALKTIAITT